ncbi:class I SAM-dependent methyltransferase [Streptomyces sp. NPDC058145]|uniref:class I SAM-dependent methyltransferase n=1 Tax=Streptomyces sp. NPDC058145 TaxID=3346356 RepID=UPI0036ECF44A
MRQQVQVEHSRRSPAYWNHLYEAGYRVKEPEAFERQMFRNYATVKAGMLAVDVGTGRGHMAAHMAKWGLMVLAYDFSTVAIADARASHQSCGDQLTFAEHDFTTDAIPPELVPGTVDVISCRHSFEFLDRPRFLTDARRWLTSAGVLQITTHRAKRMPPAAAHQGLRDEDIEQLRQGWRYMTTYGLDGDDSVIGIVLRGPR